MDDPDGIVSALVCNIKSSDAMMYVRTTTYYLDTLHHIQYMIHIFIYNIRISICVYVQISNPIQKTKKAKKSCPSAPSSHDYIQHHMRYQMVMKFH